MIVEPVPTNPRSPLRRGIRVAALTAPLVLLVAVVAAGSLGPRPVGLVVSPGPANVTSSGAPAGPASALGAVFPESWAGLRVWSVAQTLAERAAGRARGIVVVAGWFSYGTFPWMCADAYLDVDRTACQGRTLLTDTPAPVAGPNGSPAGPGPHLHPQIPAGTRFPAPDAQPGSPRSQPFPVMLLGSFDDPRRSACGGTGPRCDEDFVVDRVEWVSGVPWGVTLTVDPALRVDPNVPEVRRTVRAADGAMGPAAVILTTAVVLPSSLATIDPAAAAAVLPSLPASRRLRPLTYVRGFVFQFDASQPVFGRDPRDTWAVLDSATGRVLARDAPVPATVTPPARSPAALPAAPSPAPSR